MRFLRLYFLPAFITFLIDINFYFTALWLNYPYWLNFFKESFLIDYLYKRLYLSFMHRWFFLGSFFFNFSVLNFYQTRAIFFYLNSQIPFQIQAASVFNFLLLTLRFTLYFILFIFIFIL